MRRGVRVLAGAGADFAVLACISAHYFLPRIAAGAPIPIIDLVGEAAAEILRTRPRPRTVGLLATSGTVSSGVVARAFAAAGIAVLAPSARDQRRVMSAIYGKKGIKAGFAGGPARRILLEVADGLVGRGAEAVLAGCTEVPLVLGQADLPVPLVDPLAIGARAAVRLSGARLRRN
jgi:aspartate racemase